MTTSEKEQLLHTIQIIEGNHNIAPTNQPLMERFARLVEKIAEESVEDINFNDRPIDRIYRLFRDNKVSINIAVPPAPPVENPFAGHSYTRQGNSAFVFSDSVLQAQASDDGINWYAISDRLPYTISQDGKIYTEIVSNAVILAIDTDGNLILTSQGTDVVFEKDETTKEFIDIVIVDPFAGKSFTFYNSGAEIYVSIVFGDEGEELYQVQRSRDQITWEALSEAQSYVVDVYGHTALELHGVGPCTAYMMGSDLYVESIDGQWSETLTADVEPKEIIPVDDPFIGSWSGVAPLSGGGTSGFVVVVDDTYAQPQREYEDNPGVYYAVDAKAPYSINPDGSTDFYSESLGVSIHIELVAGQMVLSVMGTEWAVLDKDEVTKPFLPYPAPVNPYVGSWTDPTFHPSPDPDYHYPLTVVCDDTYWQPQKYNDATQEWVALQSKVPYSINQDGSVDVVIESLGGISAHIEVSGSTLTMSVGGSVVSTLPKDAETKPFLPYTE